MDKPCWKLPDKHFLPATLGLLHHPEYMKKSTAKAKMVQPREEEARRRHSLVAICLPHAQVGSGGATAKWATKRYSITWLTRNTMTLENCLLHQVNILMSYSFQTFRTVRDSHGILKDLARGVHTAYSIQVNWDFLTGDSVLITLQGHLSSPHNASLFVDKLLKEMLLHVYLKFVS